MLEPHLAISSDGLVVWPPETKDRGELWASKEGCCQPWGPANFRDPRLGSFATTAVWLLSFIFHYHASEPVSLLLGVGLLVCPHASSL